MPKHPFFSLFDDPTQWQVFASGLAEGQLSRIETENGTPGVRMDYNFHDGGGFIAMRQVISFKLPDTFEIGFRMRGEGPPNHLEFKVSAPGGANVWRFQRPDHQLPLDWKACHIHERDLPFAWGPAGGGAPADVEAVEIVIVAGPGGVGSLELGGAWLEDQTLREALSIRASSFLPGHPPDAAFDGDLQSGWRAAPEDDKPWWTMDFGRLLRFGGLVIDWPEALPPRAYEVETSDDGETWTRLYQATCTRGPISHIAAPGAEARHLRLTFEGPEGAALRAVSLRPDAFSRTPNEFVHAITEDLPRGWVPRYWYREQSYWTPVGSPEGKRRALINEEGMVEVDEGGFSLEPFVLTTEGLVTWADVTTSVSLENGGAPLPRVTWETSAFRLEILPWVDGAGDDLTLHVTYRLECTTPSPGIRLAVAARPFQVNPPWQAFRNLGGISAIHNVVVENGNLRVNERRVIATPTPAESSTAMFEEGGIIGFLLEGELPVRDSVEYDCGYASGCMAWELSPESRTMEVTVSVPYFNSEVGDIANARSAALDDWTTTLGAVRWQVPPSATEAIDCFRTAAAHILINRDGPAIQPGPRRYTRSWVRDCVIMGAALAKAGLPFALREFISWYARFQRDDGFVPCVVDRDGVDWLVEHDSHGQFLWGVREVWRAGGDRKFLSDLLPHVRKAATCLISLRAERMTANYRFGEHAACFGLLPESASHEGYLAHHVHSYWDDFWGIRGLEAAADLADGMGLGDEASDWRSEAARFHGDLLRSIEKVIADRELNYIPGSVEWADFDPTATSNAIAMLDFADSLPQGPLHAMLATYLDGHHRKHRGEMVWTNYTAYEIRIIGAFVRLGKRDTANELLEFFLSDRRPREWNQWPEITWRDPRSPGHLGDVPHTWIAAEYLLAVASMVAAEREADDSLVLASGMPWAWISEVDGFSVGDLPTRHGPLDFRIHAVRNDWIRVEIRGITLPPGGLTIVPPLPEGTRIISVECPVGNFSIVDATGESIGVKSLPFVADLCLGRRIT